MKNQAALAFVFGLIFSLKSVADSSIRPAFGGFIDTYWAYSTAKPVNIDRQFTTHAARDNEFNINLAFIEAKIESDRVRGRLALQAGTAVQVNYASEPSVGSTSGGSLSRHIQEAYIGYRIGEKTWMDAGIMFSHVGLEGFVSRDNAIYTRSLVADFSPYYQSGVKISHQFNPQWSCQFLILNGWQNVSESNREKTIGTQLTYQPNPDFSVTYNTLIGKESSFRQLHDLVLRYNVTPKWTLGSQVDFGLQKDTWYGFTLITRFSVSENGSIVSRVERYSDEKNIIVSTPNNTPFRIWGWSLGYDHSLTRELTWRNEFRNMIADRSVYLTGSGLKNTDSLFVSSLGLSF